MWVMTVRSEEEAPCKCRECKAYRDHLRGLAAFRATLSEPEYDDADLEAADRRSREDPEWYKRKK